MQPIGIELSNYACFDRQYIPLREGISVLAGKNNAGKTALLRGIASLYSLPPGQPAKNSPLTPQGIGGCFRAENRPLLTILCSTERKDHKYPGKALPSVRSLGSEMSARWQFDLSANGHLGLQGAWLHLDPTGGWQGSVSTYLVFARQQRRSDPRTTKLKF